MLCAWCIAGACAGAALVICALHIHKLETYAGTARRANFIGVILMAPVRARCSARPGCLCSCSLGPLLTASPAPPHPCRLSAPPQVFACTNFLAMFFPRAASMFELLQHVYEAQALFCFGALLLDLAAGAGTPSLDALRRWAALPAVALTWPPPPPHVLRR
jgi:hypothetical protein